ncbi:MAG TPA: DUF488 domain-containing protein [Candidatus Limnocylindrales bacterium]|nr:DUF488 domain-containing protein [Candidatus Limnocylindrales bacterium]
MGYEGQNIHSFIDLLLVQGVTRLVDVRLTPISRKPGFSKTALSHALAAADISYMHLPALGNPKSNRAGFAGNTAELANARQYFVRQIRRPAAESALDTIVELAASQRVAVLCFEANEERCHRHVVLTQARQRASSASGSRPPTH